MASVVLEPVGERVMSPLPPATIDDDPPAPSCLAPLPDDEDDDDDGDGRAKGDGELDAPDTCVLTSTIKEVEKRARAGLGHLSDFDSDVDLLSVMKKKKEPPPPPEDEMFDGEECESTEDEEFTVHFAHTGRKTSPEMTPQPELLTQISELQEAVVSMKGTLTEAVARLSSVVEDPSMTREVQETRQRCDDNTAEVLKLVLSLKSDITTLQLTLSHSLQDSLPDQPSLLVPPSVYDYVAGLRSHGLHAASSHPSTPQADATNNRQNVSVAVGGDSEDLGLVYDSDSSLTIAANKTISLSASLSQQCGLELRTAHTGPPTHHHHGHPGSTDHEHHHHHRLRQASHDRSHLRSDSDGSDQSRDAKHRHRRRSSHDRERESSDPYGVVGNRGLSSFADSRDPRESQRYRVARELLDTEKKYCKTLWTIQDTFAEPLKKAGILSHKDITTLFPEEVYQLYDKHCLLQHQLRERLASWKWQPLVGDVVARFTDPRHTDVLRLYTAYVNDFPEVLKTFHKLCRTSQPFTKFIKSCLEQPACGGLDLGAFLLTPVQRVPRYILLMKQLLKYTEPQHPDYQHLHACLERLRDFLARLNDSMEHSFQLVHAQLSPHGTVPGPSHHHPPPPQPPTSHHRPGRSPRRSSSSIGSPPVSPGSPAYSPDRVSLACSPHRSPEDRRRSPGSSTSLATPQRSHSIATQPPCRPRSVFLDNRSSSLPRGSASSSSGSRGSAASPSSDAPRTRSRSESVASRRPLPSTHTHTPLQSLVTQEGPRTLAPAHSVVDVTASLSPPRDARWEELAASEPSLLDPRPSQETSRTAANSSLSAAHSVASVDGQQKVSTPVWTESSHSDDPRSKKKSSIRTSLKNMFTFKKSRVPRAFHHHHHHHHSYHHHHLQPLRGASRGRDEGGEYWEAPPIDSSPSATQSPTLTVVSVAQPTTLTVVPASAQPPTLSMVGDFVDEEGNPCSNV
ncbi:uncharacterized protein LOC125032859 [Penaeus chinensis]|uniref:uncharacterized protein LOC125032859 n=1 Tax=Penaeus chinensis TaxID=139456 RepID=UPI001FB5CDCB|nr:uncharacterized protein LOC125032859 [Penaeus chinensis]